MKITLLTENWAERGGVAEYLWHLADGLPEGSVTVVTRSKNDRSVRAGSGVTEIQSRRLLWPLKPAWLPLFFSLRRRARNREIDILLCGRRCLRGCLVIT